MGANSQKVITNKNGVLTEVAAIKTSVGAADKDKLVATGEGGFVDPTLLNAGSTSEGAASAAKLAQLNAQGVLDDSLMGASVQGMPNKVVKTGEDGRLHPTMMPAGIGADTAALMTSEPLAAGDLVSVWSDGGVAKVRKADGSAPGKGAHGFVLAAFGAGVLATVYFEGTNTQCSDLTPGEQFLSATTAGKSGATAPTTGGAVVQRVGFAVSATALNFDSGTPIVLA